MKSGKIPVLAVLVLVAAACGASSSPRAGADGEPIRLSPQLLELLRAEMREIAAGVQVVAAALAAANWAAIHETGAAIRASYIMEKSLTPEQAAELERALPAEFKRLDAEFHERALRLAMTAETHDAEIVSFHYARLLETCARCHAQFAQARFPGFVPPAAQEHRH
jgi:hypothetical protein